LTQVNGMSAVSGTPTHLTDTSTPLRLAPRPKPPASVFAPDPKQVIAWRKLAADVADSDTFDRGAYDASYDRFQHAADRAFGEDLPGGAA
jgi:hypothetical protein